MKLLKLSVTALAMVLATQASAMEGNFKLVSSAMEQHGFKDVSIEHPAEKNTNNVAINPDSFFATAKAYNTYGTIKQNVKVIGDHYIGIANYTDRTVRYTYQYTLSCDKALVSFSYTIDLAPKGTFSDSAKTLAIVQEGVAGQYRIDADTGIQNEPLAHYHDVKTLTLGLPNLGT